MTQIMIDEAKCTACKMCELACSYHHKRVFNPEISSIEILRKGKEMEISSRVYMNAGNGNHLACDVCSGEPQPLCAKYCEWAAVNII